MLNVTAREHIPLSVTTMHYGAHIQALAPFG
jgi:hypothetical protein